MSIPNVLTYSVILGNIAVADIIEILADVLSIPRLIAHGDFTIFVFEGACRLSSSETCYYFFNIMSLLHFYSIFLIAYSFYFRYYVIIKPAPSWKRVQCTILLILIPISIPLMSKIGISLRWGQIFIMSLFARDDPETSKEILLMVYPNMDVNSTTQRSLYFFDPFSLPISLFATTVPFLVYPFIIFMRRKILRKLASIADNMNVKTKQMHESLIRALTYQTILPTTLCIGMSSFYFQQLGFRNPVIDSMIFIVSCIPAVGNPLMTLYFVSPYRRFILKRFANEQSSTVRKQSAAKL